MIALNLGRSMNGSNDDLSIVLLLDCASLDLLQDFLHLSQPYKYSRALRVALILVLTRNDQHEKGNNILELPRTFKD
jgi:hypothetical protein